MSDQVHVRVQRVSALPMQSLCWEEQGRVSQVHTLISGLGLHSHRHGLTGAHCPYNPMAWVYLFRWLRKKVPDEEGLRAPLLDLSGATPSSAILAPALAASSTAQVCSQFTAPVPLQRTKRTP